jgi:hypothetical protein
VGDEKQIPSPAKKSDARPVIDSEKPEWLEITIIFGPGNPFTIACYLPVKK